MTQTLLPLSCCSWSQKSPVRRTQHLFFSVCSPSSHSLIQHIEPLRHIHKSLIFYLKIYKNQMLCIVKALAVGGRYQLFRLLLLPLSALFLVDGRTAAAVLYGPIFFVFSRALEALVQSCSFVVVQRESILRRGVPFSSADRACLSSSRHTEEGMKKKKKVFFPMRSLSCSLSVLRIPPPCCFHLPPSSQSRISSLTPSPTPWKIF